MFFLIVSGKIFYSSEFVYLPEYLQRLPCFGLIAFLSGHLVGLKILAELTEYRTSRQGGRFKLFLLVVLSLILGFLRQFWGPNTLPGIFIYYLCLIPIFCYLIYVVASHDNQVTRLLGSSIFRLLGNSSYCLYLNHWIVLTVVSYYLSSSSGGGEDGGPTAITSGYLTLFEFGGLIVMTVLASIVLYQRVECVARKHILLLAEKRRLLS